MSRHNDLAGRRILLVEDESLVCVLTEDILAEAGCNIELAMRLDSGLQIAQDANLDAAILDINLGQGTTSYPIAQALAQRGVPFLFVSGYGADGLDARWRHIPVLQKPYTPEDLVRAVSAMMGDTEDRPGHPHPGHPS